MDEVDTFGDVALETGVGSFEQLLLVLIGAADNVDNILYTIRLDNVSEILR